MGDFRARISDEWFSWFPCLSDPGRRSALCLKVALLVIHGIYLVVPFLFGPHYLLHDAMLHPWSIGAYRLLFLLILTQYFITSTTSPGYVLDAMRAVTQSHSHSASLLSNQSATTKSSPPHLLVSMAVHLQSPLLGNHPHLGLSSSWTSILLVPVRDNGLVQLAMFCSLLELSIIMIATSVFFGLTITVFGLERA